eukprot:1158663-Pelagomonas_calceolata.AAC.1
MDEGALASREVGDELGGLQRGRHHHQPHIVWPPLLQASPCGCEHAAYMCTHTTPPAWQTGPTASHCVTTTSAGIAT